MTFARYLKNKTEEIKAETPKKPTRLDSLGTIALLLTLFFFGLGFFFQYGLDQPWSEVRSFFMTARDIAFAGVGVSVLNAAIKDLKE